MTIKKERVRDMYLNTTTIYAIRTLYSLAECQGEKTSGRIATEMDIPKQYLIKVTHKLCEHGLVQVRRGVQGGFRLAKDPEEISLWDVICIFEKEKVQAILPGEQSQFGEQIMKEMTKQMRDEYSNTTIASLIPHEMLA